MKFGALLLYLAKWPISNMAACLVLSDMCSISLAWVSSVLVRYSLGGEFELTLYAHLSPCLVLFLMGNALVGLYPGILISPPEELKKLCQSCSTIFLALSAIIFLSRQGEMYSRGIFLLAWLGALGLQPLFRALLRRWLYKRSWWGYPVAILGAGKTGRAVASFLSGDHRMGLRVMSFYDDNPNLIGTKVLGVEVRGSLDDANEIVRKYAKAVAIVAIPGASPQRLVEILDGPAASFLRQIIIPDLFGASSLWISTCDLGGIVGLEVRQKLLDPQRQAMKRCLEVGLIVACLPLLILVCAILAVWVKLDSPGPVLYCHKRIGLQGREIQILKFRSMVQNADDRLEQCLEADPEMRAEWEKSQKLRCDPRITRAGRFLRRTSLDELPQLWNVLGGDLSLVGPRPIVWSEVEKYTGGFELYKKVKPGLTGFWQISGRSNTSYAERVRLDAYYVRNWSVWFDLYIILKTPLEVLRCRGAC